MLSQNFLITIQFGSVRMFICTSKRPYIRLYVRQFVLTYYYSTNNLRNCDFVCLFKRIFCGKYVRLPDIRPNPIFHNAILLIFIYLVLQYYYLMFLKDCCFHNLNMILGFVYISRKMLLTFNLKETKT